VNHLAVALPTDQTGKPEETQEAPLVKAAIIAVGRGALDIRLGDSRHFGMLDFERS
jgi:hypothetical protein